MPRKAKAPALGPAAAALSRFEASFAKQYGEGVLIKPQKRPYEVVSTGSLELDMAMGCGGTIVGRIAEWWGPGGVSKTTMAMISAGNFQRAYPDRLVGWLDVERTFDEAWAEEHGVNLDLLRKTKPTVAQEVADHAQSMVQSGLFSLIVIDSVGGMMGRRESEGTSDDVQVAEVARVVTRLVKRQAALCDDNRTSLIIINQPRANISGGPRAGNATGGGNALKHATTHKLRFRQTGETAFTIKHGTGKTAVEEEIGFQVAVHIERNKVAPPKRVAMFNIFNQDTELYGPLGIDRANEAFALGVRKAIIGEPSTGRYQLPDREGTTHGKDKVINALRESPELVEFIRTKALEGAEDVVSVIDILEAGEQENLTDFGEDEVSAGAGAPTQLRAVSPATDAELFGAAAE